MRQRIVLHNNQSAKMDKTQLCLLDGNQLKDSKSLYQHNKLHLKEEHVCSICQKVFSLKNYLQKHLKLVHSDASYCYQDCHSKPDDFSHLHCARRGLDPTGCAFFRFKEWGRGEALRQSCQEEGVL